MAKTSESIVDAAKLFLVLLFVVPNLVNVVRSAGSDIGGVEGNIISAIASIMSPEVTLIMLVFGVISGYVLMKRESYE